MYFSRSGNAKVGIFLEFLYWLNGKLSNFGSPARFLIPARDSFGFLFGFNQFLLVRIRTRDRYQSYVLSMASSTEVCKPFLNKFDVRYRAAFRLFISA